MQRLSGIRLLREREGEGAPARHGDSVVYNVRTFLNQGEEVGLEAKLLDVVSKDSIRVIEGIHFVDHKTRLGRRQTIAGVEHALIGMKVGGYRKVRISPHLAYRDTGVPGVIPLDAVLVVELWLRAIETP